MGRRLWITADTHFGDAEAIAMFGRPFADAKTMDDALIESINATVGRRDALLHVGDFCGPHADGRKAQVAHAVAMRGRIRCRQVSLVRGNHDPASRRFESLFDRVDDLRTWRAGPDELRVNACHWPLRLWRGQHKGALLLHGHAHGGLASAGRAIDVGVDCWQWKPVPFDELLAWASRIECRPPDGWPRLQRDRDPSRLPDLPLPG